MSISKTLTVQENLIKLLKDSLAAKSQGSEYPESGVTKVTVGDVSKIPDAPEDTGDDDTINRNSKVTITVEHPQGNKIFNLSYRRLNWSHIAKDHFTTPEVLPEYDESKVAVETEAYKTKVINKVKEVADLATDSELVVNVGSGYTDQLEKIKTVDISSAETDKLFLGTKSFSVQTREDNVGVAEVEGQRKFFDDSATATAIAGATKVITPSTKNISNQANLFKGVDLSKTTSFTLDIPTDQEKVSLPEGYLADSQLPGNLVPWDKIEKVGPSALANVQTTLTDDIITNVDLSEADENSLGTPTEAVEINSFDNHLKLLASGAYKKVFINPQYTIGRQDDLLGTFDTVSFSSAAEGDNMIELSHDGLSKLLPVLETNSALAQDMSSLYTSKTTTFFPTQIIHTDTETLDSAIDLTKVTTLSKDQEVSGIRIKQLDIGHEFDTDGDQLAALNGKVHGLVVETVLLDKWADKERIEAYFKKMSPAFVASVGSWEASDKPVEPTSYEVDADGFKYTE